MDLIGALTGGLGSDAIVSAAVEGAEHTEYELRAVPKVIKAEFGGKNKLLLAWGPQ